MVTRVLVSIVFFSCVVSSADEAPGRPVAPSYIGHAIGIGAAIMSSVLGGKEVDTEDVRPVVAILTKYKVYDPQKGEYIEDAAICSGTVVDGGCVLSSAHCLPPGAIPIERQVFNGLNIKGQTPIARVTQMYRTKEVSEPGDPQDIAIFKIDKTLTPPQTLARSDLFPSDPISGVMRVAGYGVVAPSYDVETRSFGKPVGEGTRRMGTVEVPKTIDGRSAIIEAERGKAEAHAAAPGDSGGPLYTKVDGRMKVYGVTMSINNKVQNATGNGFVSTMFHRKWINATLDEAGCKETDSDSALPPPAQAKLAKWFTAFGWTPSRLRARWGNEDFRTHTPTFEHFRTMLQDMLREGQVLGEMEGLGLRMPKEVTDEEHYGTYVLDFSTTLLDATKVKSSWSPKDGRLFIKVTEEGRLDVRVKWE